MPFFREADDLLTLNPKILISLLLAYVIFVLSTDTSCDNT